MTPADRDDFEPVAGTRDIPDGKLYAAELSNGTPVCVGNVGGTFFAIHDLCPHADFKLSEGVLNADGTVECALHGARFNCRTGAVSRGPATDAVRVFATTVEDGRVMVSPSSSK